MDRIHVGSAARWNRLDVLPAPRLLLPYEVQLCEAVGITAEEYWEFFDRVVQAEKQRAKEYEYAPEINAEITTTTLAIIQLVVGVALTFRFPFSSPQTQSTQPKEKPRRAHQR